MFVLALPLSANASFFTIVAFIGGLSAATAMVIVESVALAIMVSNDLVVPFFLKRRSQLVTGRGDVGELLLRIRRIAIFLFLYWPICIIARWRRLARSACFAAVARLASRFAPVLAAGHVARHHRR
jgi:Na+/proline symporter